MPRRSLSQFGGRITSRGEPRIAALLASAWEAAEGPGRELTHGFHPYPARAHPLLVRTLIAARSAPGDRVADPFAGSGTILVEAFAAGRRAFGCDVNELALRLAWQKTRRVAPAVRSALVLEGERTARRVLQQVRRRELPGDLEMPAELHGLFDRHVFTELAALADRIAQLRNAELRGPLLFVLSSLFTKASRRAGETSMRTTGKRIAPGFLARWFDERTRELATGLAALADAAPRATPPPALALADARALPLASGSVALVVTSPPYLGTYDYAEIQRARARLLGLTLAPAERREIGARAASHADPAAALDAYRKSLADALRESARVLAPRGMAILIVGDSVAGDRPVRGDELVEGAAAAARLDLVAVASQSRPEARHEHLIALAAPPRG